MRQVHYFQAGRESVILEVVKDNDDGTFDLARTQDGEPIITGIRISDAPGDGCAIPVELDGQKAKGSKGKAKAEKKQEAAAEVAPLSDTEAEKEGDETSPFEPEVAAPAPPPED
jgi:hypothetical protein